jgi:siroheme decarboxylase
VQVPPHRLDDAGALTAEHPGVSHCYGRDGTYNLWFTLAVSPASRLGLDRTAAVLASSCGAGRYLSLPTLRMIKLQVQFGQDDQGQAQRADHSTPTRPTEEIAAAGLAAATDASYTSDAVAPIAPLTAAQVQAVRALQTDLPACPQPFELLARQADMGAAELLQAGEELLRRGAMRRYAAVLRHRKVGFAVNCMTVWNVPAERAEQAGATLAGFPEVTHCYLRPTWPDWPYNLYAMIHCRTDEHCRDLIGRMKTATSIADMLAVYSTKEYKKVRLQYFSPAFAAWEARHGG